MMKSVVKIGVLAAFAAFALASAAARTFGTTSGAGGLDTSTMTLVAGSSSRASRRTGLPNGPAYRRAT